jgi:hypothetical protein
VQAGLFDFLKRKSAAPKTNPRAQELVDELVQICTPTDAGLKTSAKRVERVEELVRVDSAGACRHTQRSI